MSALSAHDTVALVDASSFIHRDFHSAKAQDTAYTVNTRGEPVGAVKRFTERCFWWRKLGAAGLVPTYMAMVFDAARRSFRHDIFPAYKANRPALDDDLKRQMPIMREAAAALGICGVEEIGYEADDLIATYSHTIVEQGAACLIISGDKDLLQLCRVGVTIFDPPCGVEGFPGYRPARTFATDDDVIAKFGVGPEQVVDLQGLAGDPGDGVPGVPGVGVGKAAKLIQEYGSLEAVLAAAPAMVSGKKPPVMWRNILEHAELARTSRRLVKLDCCAEYSVPVEAFALEPIDHDRVLAFAERHGLPWIVTLVEKDREYARRSA